jgi:cobalt-zinc-cadmium efflux system protein
VALNSAVVVIEAFYGWRSGSLALLGDAGHNLSDVGALALAWAALVLSRAAPDVRHTYGWRRGTILAGFMNATILLVAMGALAWEAIQRLRAPSPPQAMTVIIVAGVGAVVNAFSAWLFLSGRERDLNIRGAFLHMAGDALLSVGVALSGLLYLWQGWALIDPLTSLVIAVLILVGTRSLLLQSVHLLFDGVPEGVDISAVRDYLQKLPQVRGIHDLHVWGMDASQAALTAHLVLNGPGPIDTDGLLRSASGELGRRFGIRHATLQLEGPSVGASLCVGTGDCGVP